jgi:hypothetical protein
MYRDENPSSRPYKIRACTRLHAVIQLCYSRMILEICTVAIAMMIVCINADEQESPGQNMNRRMLMLSRIPAPTIDVIMDVPP